MSKGRSEFSRVKEGTCFLKRADFPTSKVTKYTFRGSNSAYLFLPLLNGGQLLKERICSSLFLLEGLFCLEIGSNKNCSPW